MIRAVIYIKVTGAQITFLGQKFEQKLLLGVSQLYNYFFGFMKCQIIFLELECEKSLRNRENMV